MSDKDMDGRNNGPRSTNHAPSIDALIAAAAHEPPRREDDPVARLLGLVPDATQSLDGVCLKSSRQRVGISVSDLARKLNLRGWAVKPSDVLRWETRSANEVAPAMIGAIAAELRTNPAKLTKQVGVDQFRDVRSSDRFQDLARRWAELFSLSPSSAALALEYRSLATVNRGEAPDPEQTLTSLEALVDELEARGRKSL